MSIKPAVQPFFSSHREIMDNMAVKMSKMQSDLAEHKKDTAEKFAIQHHQIVDLKVENWELTNMNVELIDYCNETHVITICDLVRDTWHSIWYPNWFARQNAIKVKKMAQYRIELKTKKAAEKTVRPQRPIFTLESVHSESSMKTVSLNGGIVKV